MWRRPGSSRGGTGDDGTQHSAPGLLRTARWAPQDTSVLRFLTLADALGTEVTAGNAGNAGTGTTRDEPEARRLVREVLAGEHWRYALPLLPRLAPEALPRLAESGLVHGVAGDGERRSPSRVPSP